MGQKGAKSFCHRFFKKMFKMKNILVRGLVIKRGNYIVTQLLKILKSAKKNFFKRSNFFRNPQYPKSQQPGQFQCHLYDVVQSKIFVHTLIGFHSPSNSRGGLFQSIGFFFLWSSAESPSLAITKSLYCTFVQVNT